MLTHFNWTLRNKLQWNSNQNAKLLIYANAFENIVCEMAHILSKGRWVKQPSFWWLFACSDNSHLMAGCLATDINKFLQTTPSIFSKCLKLLSLMLSDSFLKIPPLVVQIIPIYCVCYLIYHDGIWGTKWRNISVINGVAFCCTVPFSNTQDQICVETPTWTSNENDAFGGLIIQIPLITIDHTSRSSWNSQILSNDTCHLLDSLIVFQVSYISVL